MNVCSRDISPLEQKLFEKVTKSTPERIQQQELLDLSDKGKFSFIIKKEYLDDYDEQICPEGLGLRKWLSNYKKEAQVSTAGVRGIQNILYPWDTRYPINLIGVTIATYAKAKVAVNKFKDFTLHKVAAGEVRYNTQMYTEIIARVQAALGITTHVVDEWKTMPVWMVSFVVFIYDLLGGEHVTASHAISQKIATKDINNQGSQYLVSESIEFVEEIERMFQKVEENGSFSIDFADIQDFQIDTEFLSSIDSGVIPYIKYLKKGIATDFNLSFINNLNNKVVVSCTHGSMYRTMVKVAQRLGVASKVEWIHAEEDPFFGGIGKELLNEGQENEEMFDHSCDATIMKINSQTKEMKFPVIDTMCFEKHLRNTPIGTVVLNADPDGDRLVVLQVESSEKKDELQKIGIAYQDLDAERILTIYTPNQSFLLAMDFQKTSLQDAGFFENHPRFIIKTTPSSGSWDQWAKANNIAVVNIPVGFKHIASILQKVEAQIQENPEKDVVVEDIFGEQIVLGVKPRLLFAGEESGGMVLGPEEYIQTKNGRVAVAMREKSAGEAIILCFAMAGFLEKNGMLLSDYLAAIYKKNNITMTIDIREDTVYYNEAEPDIAKLMHEKEKGEKLRTQNDKYFLTLALAKRNKTISFEQVKEVFQDEFKTLDFSNLEDILFVGDGTYLVFTDKIIENRPSGTDAKTKVYCSGSDLDECIKYAKAMGACSGQRSEKYKEYTTEEEFETSKQRSMDVYNQWSDKGMKSLQYSPAKDDIYLQGEEIVQVNVTGMFGPEKVEEGKYKEFLGAEIFKRALKFNKVIAQEDRFGPESTKEGIFGESLCNDREAIAQWIRARKQIFKSTCLWHCGIGGQALGNRGLLESIGVAQGLKVKVFEKLGSPVAKCFQEAIENGHTAGQMLLHVSSKSGTTDETMVNFQEGLATLIEELAKTQSVARDQVSDLITQYQSVEDLSTTSLADFNFSDEQKALLRAALDRVIITTTLDASQSRLYSLAISQFAKDIMGDSGLACYQIPNNIGGRFSERSLSGDVTNCFAGIDVFEMNESAKSVLDMYSDVDASKNPAISSAALLYLYDPDFVVVGVTDSTQLAKAQALAQKFPESWGKNGKGPFVVTAVGKEQIQSFAKSDTKKVFIIIEVNGSVLGQGLDAYPVIEYQQNREGAAEEGKRLQFFDTFTKWFGFFNAAEITDDIRSKEYDMRDWQKQPFVELAKRILSKTAGNANRDEATVVQEYNNLHNDIGVAPSLQRIDLFNESNEQIPRLDVIEQYKVQVAQVVTALKANEQKSDDAKLITTFKSLSEALTTQGHETDEKVDSLLENIVDYGSEEQSGELEKIAQELAVLMCDQYKKGRITVPILYTPVEDAEIVGHWFKYVCTKKGILADYGIGTREQHSYYQSLLDGKYVVFTLLVDFVRSLDSVKQEQRKIASFGLAKPYLKGLYPDQVCRLFLEAESDAFQEVKRDSAILLTKDVSNDDGVIATFRIFGRALALLGQMLNNC